MGLEEQEKPKSAADIIKQSSGNGDQTENKTDTQPVDDAGDSTSALSGDTSSKSAAERILDEQHDDQKPPVVKRDTTQGGDQVEEKDKPQSVVDEANKGEIKFDLGPPDRDLKVAEVKPVDGKQEGNQVEEPAEKPAEEPAEKPAEEPAEKPADKQVDEPAEKPGDQPADKPQESDVPQVADKPAETLLEVIKDAKNVQAKVNLITHHMDNADERLRELNVGDPNAEQKDLRLNEALKAIDSAANVVKPQDIETIRKQREVLNQEIEREQKLENKDLEKLKALKIMERNLYVLERSPGFTRANAALSLYREGKTTPEDRFGGMSPAQVALIETFKADPILRNGNDPNLWQRAREIERQNSNLQLQEDSTHVMLKLTESEFAQGKLEKVPESDKEQTPQELVSMYGSADKVPKQLIDFFKEIRNDSEKRNGKDAEMWNQLRKVEKENPGLNLQEHVAKYLRRLKIEELSNTGTAKPEEQPTVKPEEQPSVKPEDEPSVKPEDEPTVKPEDEPTVKPEDEPTVKPEDEPTVKPEDEPAVKPEIEPGQGPVKADMTGSPSDKPADKVEPESEKHEYHIETPDIESSPTVDGKSPLEQVEGAVRQYFQNLEGGAKPKDALSDDLLRTIESAIVDSDKGVTPHAERLDKEVRQAQLEVNKNQEQVETLANTKLKDLDIIWNPAAATEAEKRALPEVFKGKEEFTLSQARQELVQRFDKMINEELTVTDAEGKEVPLSDANKQIVAQHLTKLNLSRSEQEYIDSSKELGIKFGENDELKATIRNPQFQALLMEHIKLSKPLLPVLESFDTSVEKLGSTVDTYRGEFNQRSSSRVLYGRVLTEVLKDPELSAEKRALYLQAAQQQFKNGYALNVDESSSEDIAMLALQTGVKPLELLKAGLDQNQKVEKGEATMGTSVPMLANDAEKLFLYEASRLSESNAEITAEGRAKALENFKQSGLLDRMVEEADKAKDPTGNDKFMARFGYGKVLLQAGDVPGASEKFKGAYENTSDVNEAQVAFDSLLNIGADPSELFKYALEKNKEVDAGAEPKGLPLHMLARNSAKIYFLEARSNMENPSQEPDAAAKTKALETLKPLFEQMVTQADTAKVAVGDEAYMSRRVFGTVLADAQDPDAKKVLSEAFARVPNLEEGEQAFNSAKLVGATNHELLAGLLAHREEVEAKRNPGESTNEATQLSSADLLSLSTSLIRNEIETSESKIDGEEVEPQRYWKHISDKYAPQLTKLDEIFGKDLDLAKSANKALKDEYESLLPKSEEDRKRFAELNESLFSPKTRDGSINMMIQLLAGGEQEKQGRAFFEKEDPKWLKEFDDWSKLVSPDGNKETIKKMVLLEQSKPGEEAGLKDATIRNLGFEKFQTEILDYSGDRNKARLNFLEAMVDVPQELRIELVDSNPELERMKEVLSGERRQYNFDEMPVNQLIEHINSLSMRPDQITFEEPYTDENGEVKTREKTLLVPEDQDVKTLRINGEPIDLRDTEKYKIIWGKFDKESTQANLKEYKEAYEALLRRADNPEDQNGEKLSFEKIRDLIGERTRSLKDGVDYTTSPQIVKDASGAEKTEYPELTATRRVEMHEQNVSLLKRLGDPVSSRMEYAMRLETLGQREDASKVYQKAFEQLKEMPPQLIREVRSLLDSDQSNLASDFVNPGGNYREPIPAANRITELLKHIDGAVPHNNLVLNDRARVDLGETQLIDAREMEFQGEEGQKFRISDLGSLYGLNSLHTVLAKRAAVFYLAPKFEQTLKDGGVPQFINEKGEPVPEEKVPSGMALVPHGKWVNGDSDAFKPEAARRALAEAVARTEGISVDEAMEKVSEDQKKVVDMLTYLKDNGALKDLPFTQQDHELAAIYNITLSNSNPLLVRELRNDVGANIGSDLATVTAAALALAVLTRVKVLRPVAGQTNRRVLAKAATTMALTTAVAGGTRWGTMKYLTGGDDGTFEDHMWHTLGSVGVAFVGTKVISKRATGTAFRLIPEENAARMASQLGHIPGVERVLSTAGSFKHTLNLGETVANLHHNTSKLVNKMFGTSGESATLGQLKSLVAKEPTVLQHFKKSVEFTADDLAKPLSSADDMLKGAGLTEARYGLSREAFKELGERATVGDLRTALQKAGKYDPKNFRKLVDLDADDLLRPLSDDMAKEILERAGLYGAGYRGLTKTMFQELEKGKFNDIVKFTDEMAPRVESKHIVDTISDHLKTPYGKDLTIGDFRTYLQSLGPDGIKLARQIPKSADDLARPFASEYGEVVVRQLSLHGKELGQLAAKAQAEVVERTSQSLSKSLGGEASTTSIASLRSALSSVGEGGLVKQLDRAIARLSKQGHSLDDLAKVSLADDTGKALLKEAKLHHNPGVLNDPAEAIAKFSQSMGKSADDITLADLKQALKDGGFEQASRNLTKAAKESGADLTKTRLSDATDIISNAKLHYNPGILSSSADTVAMQTAQLTDDLLKTFGDDYAGPSLQSFKDHFRALNSDKSNEAFEAMFKEKFPNLDAVPLTTSLKDVMKFNLRAFDGPGLDDILSKMDPDLARAIRMEPSVKEAGSSILRGTGNKIGGTVRTAWDVSVDAVKHPVQTGKAVVDATVNTPAKVAELWRNLPSAPAPREMARIAGVKSWEGLSYGAGKTRDGVVYGLGKTGDAIGWGANKVKYGSKATWDNVKLHRLSETSGFSDVFRAGNANALHTYAGMKLAYNSTAGANELREQINPDTNKPYTYSESIMKATMPDLIGSNLTETGMKVGLTGLDLWFMSSVLRTGAIPRYTAGKYGIHAEARGVGPGLASWGKRGLHGIPRTWSRLKNYSIGEGILPETVRAATTGGAMLAANDFFEGGALGIQNSYNRGSLDWRNFSNDIGPTAKERLENSRSPISNDPFAKPPTWEELYKQAKDAEAARLEQEAKSNPESADSDPKPKPAETKPVDAVTQPVETKTDEIPNSEPTKVEIETKDAGNPQPVVPKKEDDDGAFRGTNTGGF